MGNRETGYGPARYKNIAAADEPQLTADLTAGLARASANVMYGYTAFYGGYEPCRRARPFTAPKTASTNSARVLYQTALLQH